MAESTAVAPPRNSGWRDQLFVSYSRASDHPGKLRVERWLKRLLRLDDIVAASPSGVRYQLVMHDGVQYAIFRNGAYEPQSLALMRRLLRPGDTMVDVGGHVGQYALHAAQIVERQGRVVSFEPNPRTYQYLVRNIELNRFDWVTPVLAAVDAQLHVIRMSYGDESNWGNARHSDEPTARAYFGVAVPLEATLRQLAVSRVDFLKIDVEGFEPDVLASLDLHSSLRPRDILFEFIPSMLDARQPGAASTLLERLRSADYQVTDIHGRPFGSAADLDEFNVWAHDRRREQ